MRFALIHGGAHGAWCWQRVLAELTRLGHDGVAMDLPCDDDTAGSAEYARVVVDALPTTAGPLVLVAHSLGGLTAPIVACVRETHCMIFLSALLPIPGLSFRDQQIDEAIMFPYHGGLAGLRDRFFNQCVPSDADWAMDHLRRQSETPFVETTPLEAWPDVPTAYVLCTEDRAVRPDWSRNASRTRLGVEPVELAGSDHSPFLSRPAELVQTLVAIAATA